MPVVAAFVPPSLLVADGQQSAASGTAHSDCVHDPVGLQKIEATSALPKHAGRSAMHPGRVEDIDH